jgi:hypothetical protein
MCVVAAKYFEDRGWVGVKNRDRNYIPEISFKRITKNGTEIMLFWDDITQYCEGFNSGGVAILSASLMVLDDEKEITTRASRPSKDGIKIKKALQYTNVKAAAMSLIKQKLTGNTIIFDRDTCYLIEGAWKPGGYKDKDYEYVVKEVPKDKFVVRTNHGVFLDWAGYQRSADDENQTASRVSSESRRAIADKIVHQAEDPVDIIDGMAGTYVNNPQLNVLRTSHKKKMMRTTSQIMIIPEERTFFIRPIQSHMTFNFWELNNPKHDLWVEILSNRVLWKHQKEHGEPPFPKMNHNS